MTKKEKSGIDNLLFELRCTATAYEHLIKGGWGSLSTDDRFTAYVLWGQIQGIQKALGLLGVPFEPYKD